MAEYSITIWTYDSGDWPLWVEDENGNMPIFKSKKEALEAIKDMKEKDENIAHGEVFEMKN